MASLQFMRARGSKPQRETGTGTVNRPDTLAPATPADRDEPHDHNEHPARHSGSGLDAWIRELAQAAPRSPPRNGTRSRSCSITGPAKVSLKGATG